MSRAREIFGFDKETKWEAKKRAGFTCEWPGCKEKRNLEVHHIMPCAVAYKYYPHLLPEVMRSVENSRVLCEKHHLKEHKQSHDYGTLARHLHEVGKRVRA